MRLSHSFIIVTVTQLVFIPSGYSAGDDNFPVASNMRQAYHYPTPTDFSSDTADGGGSSASTYGQVFMSSARDNERQRQPYADERAGHGEYSFSEQNSTMLNGYVTGEDTVLPAMKVGRHVNDVVGLDDSSDSTGTETALYGESDEQVVQFLKYAHSDSYVSNCKGRNINHGREKTLEVRHYLDRACVDRRSLLRFNLADFSPNSIRHAEILVRASHFDRRYVVHVLGPTNNDWLESGVTWRTSPTTEWTKNKGEGGGGYAQAGADAGAGAYKGKADGGQLRGRPICRWQRPPAMRRSFDTGLLRCDVTSHVRAHAGASLSLSLWGELHATRKATFHSRESDEEWLRPRMLITAAAHTAGCSRGLTMGPLAEDGTMEMSAPAFAPRDGSLEDVNPAPAPNADGERALLPDRFACVPPLRSCDKYPAPCLSTSASGTKDASKFSDTFTDVLGRPAADSYSTANSANSGAPSAMLPGDEVTGTGDGMGGVGGATNAAGAQWFKRKVPGSGGGGNRVRMCDTVASNAGSYGEIDAAANTGTAALSNDEKVLLGQAGDPDWNPSPCVLKSSGSDQRNTYEAASVPYKPNSPWHKTGGVRWDFASSATVRYFNIFGNTAQASQVRSEQQQPGGEESAGPPSINSIHPGDGASADVHQMYTYDIGRGEVEYQADMQSQYPGAAVNWGQYSWPKPQFHTGAHSHYSGGGGGGYSGQSVGFDGVSWSSSNYNSGYNRRLFSDVGSEDIQKLVAEKIMKPAKKIPTAPRAPPPAAVLVPALKKLLREQDGDTYDDDFSDAEEDADAKKTTKAKHPKSPPPAALAAARRRLGTTAAAAATQHTTTTVTSTGRFVPTGGGGVGGKGAGRGGSSLARTNAAVHEKLLEALRQYGVQRTNQDPRFTLSNEGKEVLDLLDRGAITTATTTAAKENAASATTATTTTPFSVQAAEDEWSRSEEGLRVLSEALHRERVERSLLSQAVHEALEEYKLGNLQEFYGSTIGARDDEIVPRGLAMYCRNDDVQRCDWLSPYSHASTLGYESTLSAGATASGGVAGLGQDLYERRGGTRRLVSEQRSSRHPVRARMNNDYERLSGTTSYAKNGALLGDDHYTDASGAGGGGRARGETLYDMSSSRDATGTAKTGRRLAGATGAKFEFSYQHYTSLQNAPDTTPTSAYQYYASPEVEAERLLTATTGLSGRSVDPHLGSSRGGARVSAHLERLGDTHPWRYSTLNSASGAAQCPMQGEKGHDCKAQFPTVVDCHPVTKTDANGNDIGEAGARPQWECSHKRHSNYCGQWDCDTLATEQMKLYELENVLRDTDKSNKREAQIEQIRVTTEITRKRQQAKAAKEQLKAQQVTEEREQDERRQRDEEELRRKNSWKLQGDSVGRSAITSNPGVSVEPGYGEIDQTTGQPKLLTWAMGGRDPDGQRPKATAWGSFENENGQLAHTSHI